MDNSIYITLSRQMQLFRDMEVTSNNIANANTTGYNAQKLAFSSYLVQDEKHKDAYANDPTTWRDTTNGAIHITENPFDLAINGQDAYFQIQTPQGVRYTRAGNFQINSAGAMVNANGYLVLGTDGGEIDIPQNSKNILINGAGQITADGQEVGQVGLMEFKDEQSMQRIGDTLLSSNETPQPSGTARVVQGAVESSNVQPVNEMVKVMELSRTTNNTAKFIEVMYDLQRKTASTYTHSQQA